MYQRVSTTNHSLAHQLDHPVAIVDIRIARGARLEITLDVPRMLDVGGPALENVLEEDAAAMKLQTELRNDLERYDRVYKRIASEQARRA